MEGTVLPIADQTMTAETIRGMTLEDFLAYCEGIHREPSRVLSEAGM